MPNRKIESSNRDRSNLPKLSWTVVNGKNLDTDFSSRALLCGSRICSMTAIFVRGSYGLWTSYGLVHGRVLFVRVTCKWIALIWWNNSFEEGFRFESMNAFSMRKGFSAEVMTLRRYQKYERCQLDQTSSNCRIPSNRSLTNLIEIRFQWDRGLPAWRSVYNVVPLFIGITLALKSVSISSRFPDANSRLSIRRLFE